MKRLIALCLAVGICAGPAQALGRRPPSPLVDLPQSEVQLTTGSGQHRFKVWIADNDQSRGRGLMFVRELAANQGMLFLFPRPQFVAFWMKNTYLSLDIAFIRADGTVINIARGAIPLSEQPIESAAPVTGVIELVAGTAARIGLATGDQVVHPAFAVRKTE